MITRKSAKRKNDAFDAKIVNTRLTKIFMAIFAPDERLPSSATLSDGDADADGDIQDGGRSPGKTVGGRCDVL